MIFITSDMHFNHDKEFIYKPRNCDNVCDMNKKIISNWNKVVSKCDTVYVLGDLMLGDNEKGIEMLNQLSGKIKVVIGNHDTDRRIDIYKNTDKIESVSWAERIMVGKTTLLLTHYPTLCSPICENKRLINVCGHTHTLNPMSSWGDHKIFHAELDANDCTPWEVNEIIEYINKNKGE